MDVGASRRCGDKNCFWYRSVDGYLAPPPLYTREKSNWIVSKNAMSIAAEGREINNELWQKLQLLSTISLARYFYAN